MDQGDKYSTFRDYLKGKGLLRIYVGYIAFVIYYVSITLLIGMTAISPTSAIFFAIYFLAGLLSVMPILIYIHYKQSNLNLDDDIDLKEI